MKVKIEFNNRSIRNHKSNFTSAKGKPLDRVDTPFNLQSVLYKGLRLREYRGGSKHFIVIFYLKGQRTKPRVQFNNLDYPAKPRWPLDEDAAFLKGAGVKL